MVLIVFVGWGWGESGTSSDVEIKKGSVMNQKTGLIHFNRTRQDLQRAKTLDEVLTIRNAAAEIKIRAERRAGEMLREGKVKGDRAETTNRLHHSRTPINGSTSTVQPTLSEIGINYNQASRWQSIASIPAEKFEQTIREIKKAGQEPTQSALLKIAGDIRRESGPVQEPLFDLDVYRRKIMRQVSAANRHIRKAIHYRDQAFRQYGVQIPLPFEFGEGQ